MNPFISKKNYINSLDRYKIHLESNQVKLIQKIINENEYGKYFIYGINNTDDEGFKEPFNDFNTLNNLKGTCLDAIKTYTAPSLNSIGNLNLHRLELSSFKISFDNNTSNKVNIFKFKISSSNIIDSNSHWLIEFYNSTSTNNTIITGSVTSIPSIPTDGFGSFGLIIGGVVNSNVNPNEEFYVKFMKNSLTSKSVSFSNQIEGVYTLFNNNFTLNDDIGIRIKAWGRFITFNNTQIDHIYRFTHLFSNNFTISGSLGEYGMLQSISIPLVRGDVVILSLKIKKIQSYMGIRINSTSVHYNSPIIGYSNTLPPMTITNSQFPSLFQNEKEIFLKIRIDSYTQVTMTVENNSYIAFDKSFLIEYIQTISQPNCFIEIYSGINEELIIY